MGTASYNNFGVQRESRKDEEGVLFPFFFLTYYLRDRSRDSRTLPNSHDETFAKIMKWCKFSRRKSSCSDMTLRRNRDIVKRVSEADAWLGIQSIQGRPRFS